MYKSPTIIPLINLKKITSVPLAIYIGKSDNLVTPTDGKLLNSSLIASRSYYREITNFDNFKLVNFPAANKISYFDNDMLVKIKAANPLEFSSTPINVFVHTNITDDDPEPDSKNSTTNNSTIVNPTPINPTEDPTPNKPKPINPKPIPPRAIYVAPPKPLRFLYNPEPIKIFWKAIVRDLYILISNLPVLSILFRDIPFWFNVIVSIM